jgi:hypothetical protein
MRDATIITEKLVKFHESEGSQAAPILLVKAGLRQDKALKSETGYVIGSGLLRVCSRGEKLNSCCIWVEFLYR